MKQDLKSMTLEEMQAAFKALGEPAFRAKQVFVWLHRGAVSFDEMTNLSKPLRQKLDELYDITAPQIVRKLRSQKDGTIKYLWKLRDGNCVESVLMQYHHGNSICISSEVGCPMGCKFCASTLAGKVRDLRPSEMLDQVLFTQLDSGREISNIVLMGMGEPLQNYENVVKAVEILTDGEGIAISKRRITLSTSGIVPHIRDIDRDMGVKLAVSLHASNNEQRSEIMPINKKYPLPELMQACHDYQENHGGYITFEYLMLKDFNDTPAHADELAALMKKYKINAKFNLIAFNPWPGCNYQPSSNNRIHAFSQKLQDYGFAAPIRTARGQDILAACGQLKSKKNGEQTGK